jgi:hypothetical protein
MKLFALGGSLVLLFSPALGGCAHHHGSMMTGHSGMMGQHGSSECPRDGTAQGAQSPQSGQHGMMGGAQQGARHECPRNAASPDAAQTPPAEAPPPTSADEHQGHHPQ